MITVLLMLPAFGLRLTLGRTWHKIQKMAPIGQDLKRERELRSISLEEIAEATKINPRFLRELEAENLDALPGEFFIRGIIREYAKYLGLDENDALNTYLESRQSDEQDRIPIRNGSSGLPKNITSAIRIAALGAFLIAVLFGLFFIFGKKEPPPSSKPKPQVSVPKQTPAPPPESEPARDEEEKVGQLNLEFSFHQDTWIQILADGEKVYSGIRLSGGKFEVSAKKEILIDLGNAGGLSYTINGMKGIPFGRPGAVEKGIAITIDNYKEFLESSENIEESQLHNGSHTQRTERTQEDSE
jgi:cytoskeletal protein RodZ